MLDFESSVFIDSQALNSVSGPITLSWGFEASWTSVDTIILSPSSECLGNKWNWRSWMFVIWFGPIRKTGHGISI